MDHIELKVALRDVRGKKVRFLRRQGVTPVHLFGHGIESLTLQCDTALLQRVLAAAGKTKLISLKLDSEKKPRTVIVREVQIPLLSRGLLHVDFYQVKTEEVMKVEVPVVLVGEAPALKLKDNVLSQEMDTLTVECLPAKIPATIELDVTSLAEPDQSLRVKDVVVEKGVAILNNPELVVAKISIRRIEKPPEVVKEKVPAAEAGEEAEAAEEEAPKEE